MKETLLTLLLVLIIDVVWAQNVIMRDDFVLDLDSGAIIPRAEWDAKQSSSWTNIITQTGTTQPTTTQNTATTQSIEITHAQTTGLIQSWNNSITRTVQTSETIQTIQSTNQTGTTQSTTGLIQSSQSLQTTIPNMQTGTRPLFTPDPNRSELDNAIAWMYSNDLTKFPTKESFMPDNIITREQMAKMISQAYTVLWYPEKRGSNPCQFGDFDTADPTLQPFITQSCQRDIIGWWWGNFHPFVTLTRAQAIAMIIRIFEGQKSDESWDPRYRNYIVKAQAMWLTTQDHTANFDVPIPRWDVAILLYRFKQASENTLARDALVQRLRTISVPGNQKIDALRLSDNIGLLTQNVGIGNDPELREATFRMFQQWLTTYAQAEEFRAFDQLQRQEAARFLGQFHQQFLLSWWLDTVPNSPQCRFSDLAAAREELRSFIIYSCNVWILRGQQWFFSPTHSMTKAEFLAAMIRMLGDAFPEPTIRAWQVWREPYFEIWLQLWLVNPMDRVAFVRNYPITRYEVAVILYRFRIKYRMLTNLNAGILENQLLALVDENPITVNGRREAKVYITTTKLADQNFTVWFIDLMDKRYKITREKVDRFFHNNFVWYGTIIDLDTDQPIGTASFVVSNNIVVEGNIRPHGNQATYYMIRRAEGTNAFYLMTEFTDNQ